MRPEQILIMTTARLAVLEIPYCVGGSFASSMYGQARNTYDLDLLVDVAPTRTRELIAAFQGDFDCDPDEVIAAIDAAPTYRDTPTARAMAKLTHRVTGFRVDLFISSGRPFEQSQFRRRIPHMIAHDPDTTVDFTAAEDIILAKLEWFALGDFASTNQWTDVRAMLLVQAEDLDWSYLRQWADTLGVRDVLELAATGEPPPRPQTDARPAGKGEQPRLF